ncbi:beta-L-arabinofuranosidase domain-containing protein [Streptomyces sp. NPDC059679]|uniref:beta-L-arabinofuranosidase domain-containing protein n=1 Tax=Streptomyces sp. NPDC059679 TaxID=3346903 RepID=UPI0036BBDA3F
MAEGRRALHPRPGLRPARPQRDQLAGLHANTQIAKMVGALRLWEQGLASRYRTIGENVWKIVTDHHT